MPGPRRRVSQQHSGRAQIHQVRTHLAVAVVVREARAAPHALGREERAGLRRDVLELAGAQVAKHGMLLRDQVDQAAVEHHDVLAPIVVEIERARAPTGILRRKLRDAGLLRDVGERQFSGIPQQPVVFGIAHP